jgi:prefoldin subunit 5
METYYSKKEYNDMQRILKKKIHLLEKQVESLTNKLNKLKNVAK